METMVSLWLKDSASLTDSNTFTMVAQTKTEDGGGNLNNTLDNPT